MDLVKSLMKFENKLCCKECPVLIKAEGSVRLYVEQNIRIDKCIYTGVTKEVISI